MTIVWFLILASAISFTIYQGTGEETLSRQITTDRHVLICVEVYSDIRAFRATTVDSTPAVTDGSGRILNNAE
jgi:hypothetical protein